MKVDDRFARSLAKVHAADVSEERYSFGDLLQQMATYSYGGNSYTLPVNTTYGNSKQESIGNDFLSYVNLAYKRNGIVFGAITARALLFSEVRFAFRRNLSRDLWTSNALRPLERPGVNQTQGEMLTRMEQDTSLAGNWYATNIYGGVRRMRPDLVDIVIGANATDAKELEFDLSAQVQGYLYWENGRHRGAKPRALTPQQVAHWSPIPDPEMRFRGMSWLQPVVREVQSDGAATDHKQKFFENGATVNLAIVAPDFIKTLEQLKEFKSMMDEGHVGTANAYKSLFLASGADVKTVGADLRQLDFKNTQGAGETRIAVAARIPAALLGISEGLAGSSLNAGNLGVARRLFADGFMRSQWRSACAALEPMVAVPADSHLWYDASEIAFLREDETDAAQITNTKAAAMRQLVDGGYEPDSVTKAVTSGDLTLLKHDGLLSVQLQEPGAQNLAAGVAPDESKSQEIIDITLALQKIYLSVDAGVISADEAREIVNRLGAGLTGPAPKAIAPAPPAVPTP